jgi:CRP/FNR family transcriptional regulator
MKRKNSFRKEEGASDCDVSHQKVFSSLTPIELDCFDEHKVCLFFRKGQTVFNEGTYPLGLFCIDTGKVKLEHSGDEGKMQIVRMKKAGDLLGYRALFCNEKYNASAVALEDTTLCFIPKDAFFEVLKVNNRLSQDLLQLLARDLREAENHLTELAQKPVRERLARALLFLKDTYGFEPGLSTINVVLSREEIADLVGTATETAIRLLAEFRSDGIIEFEGKKIAILNLKQLSRTAHYYEQEVIYY